jgi:hypothetical protein
MADFQCESDPFLRQLLLIYVLLALSSYETGDTVLF